MSLIHVLLALIGFGFTIAQIFRNFTESTVMHGDTIAGRRFGIALVLVGILMLVLGILYRLTFLRESRRAWRKWEADGLIQSGSAFRVSLALMIAVILLAISVAAILAWSSTSAHSSDPHLRHRQLKVRNVERFAPTRPDLGYCQRQHS